MNLPQPAAPGRRSGGQRVRLDAIARVLARVRPRTRTVLSMLADTLIAGLAAGAALHLQLAEGLLGGAARVHLPLIPTFMVITAATSAWFGVHRASWRYASVSELWLIVTSTTVAVLLLALARSGVSAGADVPVSAFVILWLLMIVGLGGARLAYRQLQDWRQTGTTERSHRRGRPVLLFGAGRDAELFIRATRSEPEPGYRVVGMVDDSDRLVGRAVHGVPVLGAVGKLPAIIRRLAKKGSRPTEIIFAQDAGAMSTRARRELLELAQASGLAVARLPSLSELANGARRGRIAVEPLTVEDLLGRPQHALDHAAMGHLIAGRRVLVTGAGGSIGSELVRQIAALAPAHLVLADHSELNLYNVDLEVAAAWPGLARAALICDVRDRRRVEQLFAQHRPEVVFHAAALKHVPLVEQNPAEGVLTNVQGTVNIADACIARHTKVMVLISTDKAVNPTGVMGATKRVAELYCQARDLTMQAADDPQAPTRFVTVRFGNILGSSGSVVPLFQQQIAKGGPVTVTDPAMTRYFMTNREAVTLILQASAHGLKGRIGRGQIFILDMGEPVQILEVARQLIRLAGLTPEVDVGIDLIGLRPGEKLHEDLFYPDEQPVPTHVDGVLAVHSRPVPLDLLRPAIEALVSAAARNQGVPIPDLLNTLLQRFDGFQPPVAELETGYFAGLAGQDHHGLGAWTGLGARDGLGVGVPPSIPDDDLAIPAPAASALRSVS